MPRFDASYQVRIGLVDPQLPDGQKSAAMPTIEEMVATVTTALEAAFPAYEAHVAAERLDRD